MKLGVLFAMLRIGLRGWSDHNKYTQANIFNPSTLVY